LTVSRPVTCFSACEEAGADQKPVGGELLA
jgi:hypothetical protein